MRYFIAYKDYKGKDNYGIPWIHPENGYDDLDHGLNVRDDFENRGFKDVVIFNCEEEVPEEITCYYVKDNKIR